jgi:hypothetical protein
LKAADHARHAFHARFQISDPRGQVAVAAASRVAGAVVRIVRPRQAPWNDDAAVVCAHTSAPVGHGAGFSATLATAQIAMNLAKTSHGDFGFQRFSAASASAAGRGRHSMPTRCNAPLGTRALQ